MSEKNYTNGEITVHCKIEKCIHSANCVKGLPSVFKPMERPWIKIKAESSEVICAQVDKCPSGALTWSKNS
mgnify:CR=1 FL=1